MSWLVMNQGYLIVLRKFFLEIRSISAQPLSDISAGPAFLLGIQNNFEEAKKILDEKTYDFWRLIYDAVQKTGLKTVFENASVTDLANVINYFLT